MKKINKRIRTFNPFCGSIPVQIGLILDFNQNLIIFAIEQQVGLSLRQLMSRRKVRATESAILPNGKLFVRADQCNRE